MINCNKPIIFLVNRENEKCSRKYVILFLYLRKNNLLDSGQTRTYYFVFALLSSQRSRGLFLSDYYVRPNVFMSLQMTYDLDLLTYACKIGAESSKKMPFIATGEVKPFCKLYYKLLCPKF